MLALPMPFMRAMNPTSAGVAVVPRLSMPQGEHATLAMVPLVEPTVDRTVGLIHRRGRELPPMARKLYQLIEKTWPRRMR